MDIGSLISSAGSAINSFGGVATSPVTTREADKAAMSGATAGGITLAGAVAFYALLRFTGLLPRWARII